MCNTEINVSFHILLEYCATTRYTLRNSTGKVLCVEGHFSTHTVGNVLFIYIWGGNIAYVWCPKPKLPWKLVSFTLYLWHEFLNDSFCSVSMYWHLSAISRDIENESLSRLRNILPVKRVKWFVTTLPLCESRFHIMGNPHTMNLNCSLGGGGIRFGSDFTIQFTVSLKEFIFCVIRNINR
jgi:hypothetical protein